MEACASLRTLLKAKGRARRTLLERADVRSSGSQNKRNDLVPSLQLVERDPASLICPQRNVRKLDSAHVRDVARSITALGFCDPVLVDETNTVLDGVARVEAAKLVGITSIACIVASHLSAMQKRQLRLALNRLQEKGSWDLAELRIEVGELILEDVPIDITGFAPTEIDQILLEEDPPVVEPGPLEPNPGASPVAQLGDIFTLGQHKVICGDARDPAVLATIMATHKAQLVITDEPYNVPIGGHVTGGAHREFAMASGEMSPAAFEEFNTAWMRAALTFLVDGGILGTFIDWRGYPTANAAATSLGVMPLNLIVWGKTNAGMGSLYRSQHELLPLYKKGQAQHVNNIKLGKDGRWRSNLWRYPGASSLGSDARKGLLDHPTVKPAAMLGDALLDLTNRNDIVLDPFLGSGSTLIAAEQTGRRCRGIEIDPLYIDLVVRRFENLTGQRAVRERAQAIAT